jgi:5-methylcytosine-specific restriction endonuclease McrA
LPRRLKAEIILRQDGRCADCGTRLIMGFFVFDHRPPLALRAEDADANDPERLAAICWACDQQKTPRDLKEIARNDRVARKHQAFLERQREKQPGRPLPSPNQWRALKRFVGEPLGTRATPKSDKPSSDE